MEIYLRTSAGRYVCAEAGPVEAASEQVQYHSLLMLTPYDPVRRSHADDPTPRSQGLVLLHTPEGQLLVPEPVGAGWRLALADKSRSGAPQIGYDVFRIFKPNVPKDAPVGYGDTVVFRFTPQGQPDSALWLSAAQPGALTLRETQVPEATETFSLHLPVDMIDFTAQYDDISNGLKGKVVMSGETLPGGHLVLIDSPDGGEFVSPAQVIITETHTFTLPLGVAATQLSPCHPRTITLRAVYPASGETLEEPVRLEGDRALFLNMRVMAAQKPKSRLPVLSGKPTIHIEALLALDPSAQKLEPGNIPMPVKLEADNQYLKNLTQDLDRVTFDRPIKFTFSIQPPPEGSTPICTVITAKYRLDGKLRISRFAALIRPNGIALDPQG